MGKNIDDINIPKPSNEEVKKYIGEWDKNTEYFDKEKALNKLFLKLCPKNTDIKDILLKASILNDFYSTNIFSIYPVAEHIYKMKIDSKLEEGDISAVSDIKSVIIGGKKKELYSFASKYCSHHNPEEYPIYDSYVDEVLWYFRKPPYSSNHENPNFSNFKRKDLKDYGEFKKILLKFRDFYGLNEYSLKQIDQYLWQLGKEYF